MALLTSAPRGTKDVLPDEVYRWQYLEGVLRKTAADFGFREIRFPTFEHTELFLRGVGDTTDVVQKEMYTFEDKGGRSITLRPEGTASVARCFQEHSLFAGPLPVKLYYIAPNFRYEKPQAGRLREHHQFGVECFGAAEPQADAEIIGLAWTFLRRLGLKSIRLKINSIGCPNCRPGYHKALRDYFEGHREELCGTCQERLSKNPLRILDCKSEICQGIAQDAPHTFDYLCPDCREHLDRLTAYLTDMEIPFTLDSRIVRGLDYYTRTVFEFVTDSIGAQGTVCGGGRYDGLIEALGGDPMPGIGFGSGLERLLLVMEAEGIQIPKPDGAALFVAYIGEQPERRAQQLVHQLRQLGVAAARDLTGRSLKAQMKFADKSGARYSMVIGDNELETGRIRVKDMRTGETLECGLTAEALRDALMGKE